jgi:hypothetical protein
VRVGFGVYVLVCAEPDERIDVGGCSCERTGSETQNGGDIHRSEVCPVCADYLSKVS